MSGLMDHPARTAARSSEHLGARGVGMTRLGAPGVRSLSDRISSIAVVLENDRSGARRIGVPISFVALSPLV